MASSSRTHAQALSSAKGKKQFEAEEQEEFSRAFDDGVVLVEAEFELQSLLRRDEEALEKYTQSLQSDPTRSDEDLDSAVLRYEQILLARSKRRRRHLKNRISFYANEVTKARRVAAIEDKRRFKVFAWRYVCRFGAPPNLADFIDRLKVRMYHVVTRDGGHLNVLSDRALRDALHELGVKGAPGYKGTRAKDRIRDNSKP